MDTKVKNVFTKTANILVIIIAVFVLIIAVSYVASKNKGYSSFFGYTVYAVRTESMTGDKPNSFNKGDLIFVKLINDEERANLTEGTVITFFAFLDVDGDGKPERVLNTHRIDSITAVGQFMTKGDNNTEVDSSPIDRDSEDIIGVYSGKIPVIGAVSLFIKSSKIGFLICVVIPSVLVVIYCAYLLFKNLREYGSEKKKEDKEQMRAELLRELQEDEKSEDGNTPTDKEDGN